jgi:hypothetical protein
LRRNTCTTTKKGKHQQSNWPKAYQIGRSLKHRGVKVAISQAVPCVEFS